MIHIDSEHDPRLAMLTNLKDRELSVRHGLFVAEGEHLLRRLLASDFAIATVLLAERRANEMVPIVGDRAPIYVVRQDVMDRVVGFKFHSGILAAAVRPARRSVEHLLSTTGDVRLVVCPEIAVGENLGSLIRLSAGFGATGLLLGERCCDAFDRQTVRVSMGTVFRLPIARSNDVLADLHRMSEIGVHRVATVLDERATPLKQADRYQRLALVFGNEAQGLDPAYMAAADERVTIPMQLGTDSLNVAAAAGIFMYHYWSEGEQSLPSRVAVRST